MKGTNVLMIWDRMGDYHRVRWKATQEVLKNRQVFAADLGGSDKLYNWANTTGDMHFRLSQKDPASFDFSRIKNFVRLLRTKDIGYVCVAGYGRPEYILFILYSWLTNRKVLLFAESWYPSKKLFDMIKGSFLRRCCSVFLVSGKRAEEHFTNRLQIPQERVKVGYSVVDNRHFSSLAIGRPKTILCIGRFAPEKNLHLLIRSFSSSLLPANGWDLRIVGGGPLQDSLRELAVNKPVTLL